MSKNKNKTRLLKEYGAAVFNFLGDWEYLKYVLQATVWAFLNVENETGLCVTYNLDIDELIGTIKRLSNYRFPKEKQHIRNPTEKELDDLINKVSNQKIKLKSGEEISLITLRNDLAHFIEPEFTEDGTLHFARISAQKREMRISLNYITVKDILIANFLTVDLTNLLMTFILNNFPDALITLPKRLLQQAQDPKK